MQGYSDYLRLIVKVHIKIMKSYNCLKIMKYIKIIKIRKRSDINILKGVTGNYREIKN